VTTVGVLSSDAEFMQACRASLAADNFRVRRCNDCDDLILRNGIVQAVVVHDGLTTEPIEHACATLRRRDPTMVLVVFGASSASEAKRLAILATGADYASRSFRELSARVRLGINRARTAHRRERVELRGRLMTVGPREVRLTWCEATILQRLIQLAGSPSRGRT
jgi:DNA-binding response OmpR family regulator